MITIDKGVARPAKPSRTREGKFPWDTMEVNDSFLAAPRKGKVLVPKHLKDTGKKFSQYPEGDGYRVFRDA